MNFGQAIEAGNPDRVREWVHGGIVNVNDPVSGNEHQNMLPLTIAAYYGHVKIAQILLEHGADINALSKFANYRGTYTALFVSLCKNRMSMVEFLLSKMADPRKYDSALTVYNTPLFASSTKSNLKATKLLLASPYIDTTIKDEDEKTAGDVAEDDLIKKLIQIKFYEQQREKLCQEVNSLELSAIEQKITEKHEEFNDVSSKIGKLTVEISEKMDKLEELKIKCMMFEIELVKLNEDKLILTSTP